MFGRTKVGTPVRGMTTETQANLTNTASVIPDPNGGMPDMYYDFPDRVDLNSAAPAINDPSTDDIVYFKAGVAYDGSINDRRAEQVSAPEYAGQNVWHSGTDGGGNTPDVYAGSFNDNLIGGPDIGGISGTNTTPYSMVGPVDAAETPYLGITSKLNFQVPGYNGPVVGGSMDYAQAVALAYNAKQAAEYDRIAAEQAMMVAI